MSDEPRDPALEDVLQLVIEHALASARTMLPARIEAYNATKQSASIQVLIKEAHIAEDGERTAVTVPQMHDVPVWHFGGASGRVTVPVKVGDVGMAVFASSSIARQKLVGGIVDPADDRHHSINDCYFVPGGHDFAHVPTTAPTDAVVIHAGGGIKAKIGGPTGTEPTLMGDSFLAALDTLIAAIGTAVGTIAGGAAAAGDIATALTAFQNAGLRAAYKTSKTEVK